MHGYAKAEGREQDPKFTDDAGSMGASTDVVRVDHPAFGRIRAARVSGQVNLFDVDWPQQHYITLSISGASLRRSLSRDWIYTGKEIVEVAMSEVQWAQMLTGMNTEGAPCTLNHGFDPKSGKFVSFPAIPPRAGEDYHHTEEVKAAADKAAAQIAEAEKALSALLDGKGTPTKGALQEVLGLIRSGRRSITESLPFVVESATEAISETSVNAKAEVQAFMGHATQQLGERAIATAIAHRVALGEDPKDALLNLIAPPAPEDERG